MCQSASSKVLFPLQRKPLDFVELFLSTPGFPVRPRLGSCEGAGSLLWPEDTDKVGEPISHGSLKGSHANRCALG